MENTLLIIIGRIKKILDRFEIRILFDSNKEGNINIFDSDNELKKSLTLTGDKSNIIKLIVKGEKKHVLTAKFNDKNHKFEFNTTQTPNIAFVSCCGYKSVIINNKIDNDYKTLNKLSKENYDIMIHMGDQIYSDSIKSNKKKKLTNEYRNMYMKVFGSNAMQKILRKGSHIMVCDDHEFFDGIDHRQKKTKYTKAALNMYLEYQEKLWDKNYSKCKILSLSNYQIIIPNLKYESIFNYNPDRPFISEKLQNIVVENMVKNKTNILVTSVPILGNNKFGSWLKSKLSPVEKDDSTHPNNAANTLLFLDKIRKKNVKTIFVSGDLHLSCKSKIFYKNKLLGYQYISSGLSRGTTINQYLKYYMYYLILDKFNFGLYKLGEYKCYYKQRSYDTNYTLLKNDKTVTQYRGNNYKLKNLYNNNFYIINLIIMFAIFNVIKQKYKK